MPEPRLSSTIQPNKTTAACNRRVSINQRSAASRSTKNEATPVTNGRSGNRGLARSTFLRSSCLGHHPTRLIADGVHPAARFQRRRRCRSPGSRSSRAELARAGRRSIRRRAIGRPPRSTEIRRRHPAPLSHAAATRAQERKVTRLRSGDGRRTTWRAVCRRRGDRGERLARGTPVRELRHCSGDSGTSARLDRAEPSSVHRRPDSQNGTPSCSAPPPCVPFTACYASRAPDDATIASPPESEGDNQDVAGAIALGFPPRIIAVRLEFQPQHNARDDDGTQRQHQHHRVDVGSRLLLDGRAS